MGVNKRVLKLWMEDRENMLITLRTLSKLGVLKVDDVDTAAETLDKFALARRTAECNRV